MGHDAVPGPRVVPDLRGAEHRFTASATGEFEHHTHKRYADTGLILDAVVEHGFGSSTGRSAIRRMNQMHGAYGISNDDMRYVLSTFVVVPMRWMDRFGWRPMSESERVASANHYRELGRHMNIKDAPVTYQEFAALMDDYEREHFAFSPGGRAVSDATLRLLAEFYPRPVRGLVRRSTVALLDPPLREAFHYPEPSRLVRAVTVGGLRARAAVERRLPSRRDPVHVRELREFAIYPGGYRVEDSGRSRATSKSGAACASASNFPRSSARFAGRSTSRWRRRPRRSASSRSGSATTCSTTRRTARHGRRGRC